MAKVSLEWGALEGESPVSPALCALNVVDVRVVLLGIAVRIGSYTSAKAKYNGKTDSEQVA